MPQYLPAPLRYFKARLRPFKRPIVWLPTALLMFTSVVLWDYAQNAVERFADGLDDNAETSTNVSELEGTLSPEEMAMGADIDNLTVLQNEMATSRRVEEKAEVTNSEVTNSVENQNKENRVAGSEDGLLKGLMADFDILPLFSTGSPRQQGQESQSQSIQQRLETATKRYQLGEQSGNSHVTEVPSLSISSARWLQQEKTRLPQSNSNRLVYRNGMLDLYGASDTSDRAAPVSVLQLAIDRLSAPIETTASSNPTNLNPEFNQAGWEYSTTVLQAAMERYRLPSVAPGVEATTANESRTVEGRTRPQNTDSSLLTPVSPSQILSGEVSVPLPQVVGQEGYTLPPGFTANPPVNAYTQLTQPQAFPGVVPGVDRNTAPTIPPNVVPIAPTLTPIVPYPMQTAPALPSIGVGYSAPGMAAGEVTPTAPWQQASPPPFSVPRTIGGGQINTFSNP